ncbi:hypothetical protein V8687_21155 [Shewanella baltica]|uniref:hypothetical protein n=1 Tax=Shewanella baltica TaxID=62322 RepID=UPI0030CCA0D3
MKMDLIPTVTSLLVQDAISISGDNDLIEKFTEHVYLHSFGYEHPPTFDSSGYPCLIYAERTVPQLSDSIDRPISKQVLYSITLLPEKFEVLVHVHSADSSDNITKPIYTVIKPNLSMLDNAFSALYNHIDDSTQFLICQYCHQLVASELCSDNTCGGIYSNNSRSELSAHQHCESTYKQVFDTRLVDRVSITGETVNVFKDEDEIKFYVLATAWAAPHESCSYHSVIATLPLSASLDEVNALRLKLEAEQQYPAPCYHCDKQCDEGEAIHLDSLVDFDTDDIVCYACATLHYGVVY